jgi:hypothetical protein
MIRHWGRVLHLSSASVTRSTTTIIYRLTRILLVRSAARDLSRPASRIACEIVSCIKIEMTIRQRCWSLAQEDREATSRTALVHFRGEGTYKSHPQKAYVAHMLQVNRFQW